ncbi:hypothetical protein [Micromonospora sp. NPDC049679]|uniref:hypothetical protein n=1 Tax=Micromonospora sp. NPDC049679 TaxID=3155920 RepID=UPI003410459F
MEESLSRVPANRPVDGLERISATDRTATVTCTVDARGEFVDLGIGADWWYSVGPSGIASAILDALQFAQDKAMLARMTLRRRGRQVPAAPRDDPFSAGDSASGPSRDAWAAWAAAEAKVERGYALMTIADRVAELRDSGQPRSISGPSGLFRLHLVGFAITGSEVDVQSLSELDTDRLAEDARAALRQASREQDPAYWFVGEGARR